MFGAFSSSEARISLPHDEATRRERENARWPDTGDQRDGHLAADAGAHEIGEVPPADAAAGPTEESGDDDPERDERGENREPEAAEPEQFGDRRSRAVVP